MALRQREWAARARRDLMQQLGRACAWCGSKKRLTFDCIVPTGDGLRGHHAYEWSWRISFYRRQFQEDNLQVLCDVCNSRKGNTTLDFRTVPEMNWEHLGELTPF
ncbi:MAG: HNH endonuclease [Verrucomicrobia bacterium]|jgi:5-methylcytosine-specific restriction endonuclease McrA|nr:HNH endonuclease [Verrucomicrobiota bacterium]